MTIKEDNEKINNNLDGLALIDHLQENNKCVCGNCDKQFNVARKIAVILSEAYNIQNNQTEKDMSRAIVLGLLGSGIGPRSLYEQSVFIGAESLEIIHSMSSNPSIVESYKKFTIHLLEALSNTPQNFEPDTSDSNIH